MIPITQATGDSMDESRTVSTLMNVIRAGVVVERDVPVTANTINTDFRGNIRWTCKITVTAQRWETLDIDPETCRIALFYGVESTGAPQRIPQGVYQVTNATPSTDGAWQVDGEGLESYVIQDAFLTPRSPPFGVPTGTAIRNLISESVPGTVTFIERHTNNRNVLATAPWDRDRMDAVNDLAAAVGAQVYADEQGRFVIEDLPNLATGVPVYELKEGAGGVVMDQVEERTRDGVYNTVVASGSSSDPDIPPVYAVAQNTDPASPSRVGGEFGRRAYFMTSQFLTTVAQCQAAADRQLAELRAATRSVKLTAPPLPHLVAGDLVWLRRREGQREVHLLLDTGIGWAHGSTWTATTQSAASGG